MFEIESIIVEVRPLAVHTKGKCDWKTVKMSE